jgi:hypothetical protein
VADDGGGDDIGMDVYAGAGADVVIGAGIDVDIGVGIDVDDGIGEDCADAMPVDASASAAVASISRLDCCMLEAPVKLLGCLSGAVLPQRNEIDACSV